MPRPRLLTTDDWPESELRAAVLAGELVAVGDCWSSSSEPQDPPLRAAAVAWALPDVRLVAATRTAAWVWGGLSRPPLPHECVLPTRVRLRVDQVVRVREVALPASEVLEVAGLRVTTPLRTAVDLLRATGVSAGRMHRADEDAVTGLVATGAVPLSELERTVDGLGVIPMARQAARRMRTLFPGVTGPVALGPAGAG